MLSQHNDYGADITSINTASYRRGRQLSCDSSSIHQQFLFFFFWVDLPQCLSLKTKRVTEKSGREMKGEPKPTLRSSNTTPLTPISSPYIAEALETISSVQMLSSQPWKPRNSAHTAHSGFEIALHFSPNSSSQEAWGINCRLSLVREMSGQDDERAEAHRVCCGAVDLSLRRWEVGDSASVLQVLGVPEQHDTLDLILYRRAQLRDRCRHDGGALTISTPPHVSTRLDNQYQSCCGRRSGLSYLYPPATTAELGHLVLASVNSLLASLIAARLVPSGRALEAKSAMYGPPTPCTQTWESPYCLSRASATVGPALPP